MYIIEYMANYTFWSDEEINLLKTLVNRNQGFPQMVPLFPGRTARSLNKKAIKLGLANPHHYQKHSIDENFFKEPNLLNSNISGNFASDGYIRKRGSNYLFVWQVCTKDVVILENVKKFTNFTGPIRSYERKNYKKDTFKQVSYMFVSCANQWAEDLKNNFGIVPHKTLRMSPPNLSNDLLKFSYILGSLDGDGNIYCSPENRIALRMYSCNIEILNWMKDVFSNFLIKIDNSLEYKCNIFKHKNSNCYTLFVYDLRAAIIIDYLSQFPVPKLERKWAQPAILAKIAQYKLKYPDFFQSFPNENPDFSI